jgi:hypothetical protein
MKVKFNKSLQLMEKIPLMTQDYKRVNRMKRVKGEETLVLGCHKHFSLLDNEHGSLKEIMTIPNVHSGDILDFELWDRYLYSRGKNETDVKVTTFGIVPTPQPKPVLSPRSDEPRPVVFIPSKYDLFKRFKIDCSFINGNKSFIRFFRETSGVC